MLGHVVCVCDGSVQDSCSSHTNLIHHLAVARCSTSIIFYQKQLHVSKIISSHKTGAA